MKKKGAKGVSGILGLVLVIAFGFALSFYYRDLPRTPQPEVGRIYPLNNHGTILYLNEHEKREQEASFAICLVMFFVLVVIDYFFDTYHQRNAWSPSKRKPPWDHRWGP